MSEDQANSATRTAAEQSVDAGVLETLQSLVVAFVLAMAFRGFVTEGFVIPTGSMAPTLLGRHTLVNSPVTGYEYPADAKFAQVNLIDPMIGQGRDMKIGTTTARRLAESTRMGDRILVLKSLYPFAGPERFDVVVFKNPTDPVGDTQNYIKRLIGLPNEKIWLADGDVFAGPTDAPGVEDFRIQRKPEHVQRAVWRAVHNSDFAAYGEDPPRNAMPPWLGDRWDTTGRRYRCDDAAESMLEWTNRDIQISDWTAYNVFMSPTQPYAVSDFRVAAGIAPDQDGLRTCLELETRGHRFELLIEDDRATLRYRPLEGPPDQWTATVTSDPLHLPASGHVWDVEFWHVDQRLAIYIDEECVVELPYEWSPVRRIEAATGLELQQALRRFRPNAPRLQWRFAGSPVTLHRVRVDRDLYYRPGPGALPRPQQPARPVADVYRSITMPGTSMYGTHPDKLARLGPDHYMMAGDNSPKSQDSRLWGAPHPLVARDIDDVPFLVHRRLLLGKAWLVYFPAPVAGLPAPLPRRWRVVPDFGRIRFIR